MDTKKVEVIKKIIEVFETGKVSSNYGIITILNDGAGISYGKHQATDHSDSLDAIILRYIDLKGMFSKQLIPYLGALRNNLTTDVDPKNPPSWVQNLMSVLKSAGEKDPKMAAAQNHVFDIRYWVPAMDHFNSMQLKYPLSLAVIYDSCIHSGPDGVGRIRQLFPELPPSADGDEKTWTTAYVKTRRNWLANYEVEAVRETVYRMDAFLKMIADNNWDLNKSVVILGQKIV